MTLPGGIDEVAGHVFVGVAAGQDAGLARPDRLLDLVPERLPHGTPPVARYPNAPTSCWIMPEISRTRRKLRRIGSNSVRCSAS